MPKASDTSSAKTKRQQSRKSATTTYRIRFTVCDGDFEYGQYTDSIADNGSDLPKAISTLIAKAKRPY